MAADSGSQRLETEMEACYQGLEVGGELHTIARHVRSLVAALVSGGLLGALRTGSVLPWIMKAYATRIAASAGKDMKVVYIKGRA